MIQRRALRCAGGVVLGALVGASGLSLPACLEPPPRSLCVKHDRSCGGPSVCDADDECVPAEALDADAVTECDDGRCVWDCSDGASCPDGWSCEAEDVDLADLLSRC